MSSIPGIPGTKRRRIGSTVKEKEEGGRWTSSPNSFGPHCSGHVKFSTSPGLESFSQLEKHRAKKMSLDLHVRQDYKSS